MSEHYERTVDLKAAEKLIDNLKFEDASELSEPKAELDRLVMLRCECGADFSRKQEYFDSYEEYKDEYPLAARFFKRKITFCDKCHHKKMKQAIKALPDILKALAT